MGVTGGWWLSGTDGRYAREGGGYCRYGEWHHGTLINFLAFSKCFFFLVYCLVLSAFWYPHLSPQLTGVRIE